MQTEEQPLCLKYCQTCWWLNTDTVQSPSFRWGCWWSNFLLLNWSDNHFQCRFQFHFEAIFGKKKKETNSLSILWPREDIKLSVQNLTAPVVTRTATRRQPVQEAITLAKLCMEMFYKAYPTSEKAEVKADLQPLKRKYIFFCLCWIKLITSPPHQYHPWRLRFEFCIADASSSQE